MPTTIFICADCLEEVTYDVPAGGGAAGYCIVREDGIDKKVCYGCMGKRDRADMSATGRAVLYLLSSPDSIVPNWPRITNWPGTLCFMAKHKKTGRHNLAGCRTDVWFTDSDGRWWGVNCGDNQILRCRRLKGKPGFGR